MSATYSFKKIDNYEWLKYHCDYTPNGFYFDESLYFTTIVTSYNNGSYSNASTLNDPDNVVTSSDIFYMLNTEGIKVDLIIRGTEMGTLILPLASIDGYAYFSNDELSLKVDADGAVSVSSDVT